jgi:hypothetical protein
MRLLAKDFGFRRVGPARDLDRDLGWVNGLK